MTEAEVEVNDVDGDVEVEIVRGRKGERGGGRERKGKEK